MATWKPTRRDLRKFLADVANNPGKTYYAVGECVQPWGDEPKYWEIVFKPSSLWVGKWGHHSAEAVLSLYGPISDTRPTGIRPLFERGGQQHVPDAQVPAENSGWLRSRKPATAGRR
jgi:hypothetical protein